MADDAIRSVMVSSMEASGLDITGVDDGSSGDGDNAVSVDGDSTGGGDTGETGNAEAVGTQEQTTQQPPTQAEIDEFDAMLLEAGYKGLDGKLDWKRRVPLSKAKQLMAQHREKLEKSLAEKHASELKTHTDWRTNAERELEEMNAVGAIMQNEPERFIEMLKAADPRYRQFIKDAEEAALYGESAPRRQPVGDQAPGPDIELSDGSRTYSVEGLAKREEWLAAQIEKRIESKYEQKFGPIAKSYEEHQRVRAAVPKIQAQLKEAESWQGFNENQADILKVLQSDKAISLEGAYLRVVGPKLAADRQKIRQEVLDELKSKPHSTSIQPQTPVQKRDSNEPRDLNDVIKQAMREKGLKF